jgi:DnaJ-domain-containing protein 1
MKYHPDMQARSTEAEKLRASERAKLINEAYRKIKLEMK